MNKNRYEKGLAKIKEIIGNEGEKVIKALEDTAPDFVKLIIEFPYGDIYTRPGLDIKSREIAAIAALTVMGNVTPQLKTHIRSALRAGCSKQEVVEVIMQMAAYAGFPVALNAMLAAKEVFNGKDKK